MIVKFFTRGTGGSGGVFNYLLKDNEQEDGLRLDAEVLRGDIDNQAMLIDSLDFKQKYTSGCLSFTESADQVTQVQKEQLMDSFEETIRAGLDVDRVSVSWIEHRDKGRLELNFVYANVDLKHGRAFQPYVHVHDLKRVNAWKDMQNIEHGFTNPSDPAKKRLMGQRDNLPRDIKDARQAITDGLQVLVGEGLITNRADVIQALTEGGFEIARETDKAISIKNIDPEAKRNIRLTGVLYERDFKPIAEIQAEVTTASEEYRGRATDRYDAAKRLYENEIERKRDYHQTRHGQPRHKQRGVKDAAINTKNRYRYSPQSLLTAAPRPFDRRYKRPSRKNADTDRELLYTDRGFDTAARGQVSENHQVRNEVMGNRSGHSGGHTANDGHSIGGLDSQQFLKTDSHTAIRQPSVRQTTTDQLRAAEVSNGQETARAGAESPTIARGHDTATEADARRQRPRYSGIDSIIEEVGTSANTASRTLADIARAVTDQDQRTDKHTEWLDESSQKLLGEHESLSERVNDVMQRSNSASRDHERVSECDSARRESKRQYGAVKGQIERLTGSTDRTRELTKENNQLAERNRDRSDGIKQVADQIKEVIKTQENQRQQRFPAPRMGR